MGLIIIGDVPDDIPSLIVRAGDCGGVVICQSNSVVDEVKLKALDMGVSIKEPIAIQWLHLYKQELEKKETPVLIYNPEKVLRYVLDVTSGHNVRKDSKIDNKTRIHTPDRKGIRKFK